MLFPILSTKQAEWKSKMGRCLTDMWQDFKHNKKSGR